MHILGIPIRIPIAKKVGKKNEKEQAKSGSPLPGSIFRRFIRNKTYQPLWQLVGRIFNSLKPDRIIIKGEYGFYEPDYTAWLYTILLLAPSKPPHYLLQLQPVWDDERLDIEANIKGSIALAAVAFNLIIFLTNPSVFRLFKDIQLHKKQCRKQKQLRMQTTS